MGRKAERKAKHKAKHKAKRKEATKKDMTVAGTTGQKIKAAREACGYTQDQLARAISTPDDPVSWDRIAAWEQGRQGISNLARLYRLAAALDRPMEFFVADADRACLRPPGRG